MQQHMLRASVSAFPSPAEQPTIISNLKEFIYLPEFLLCLLLPTAEVHSGCLD